MNQKFFFMKLAIFLLLTTSLTLVGCSAPATAPAPTLTNTPPPTATPSPYGIVVGKITTGGSLLTEKISATLIPVAVEQDGKVTLKPELIKERMVSVEAPTGEFRLEDVKPGDYFMSVSINGEAPINVSSKTGEMRIIHIEAGDIVDLGEIAFVDTPGNPVIKDESEAN